MSYSSLEVFPHHDTGEHSETCKLAGETNGEAQKPSDGSKDADPPTRQTLLWNVDGIYDSIR